MGDSDAGPKRILHFPPPPNPLATHTQQAETLAPGSSPPIIGRGELRDLVVNVARLLDAFDLYISQVRTLARVARDHPGVSGDDIDRIIRNAEVDAQRLAEIRAAYRALADTLAEPGEDTPRDA